MLQFSIFNKKRDIKFGIGLLFFLSFVVWVFCFRDFIFGRLSLQSDAISYYNHIKFFIDNIMHGIYPLWDPVWNCGVPNEFFLRRFGSFNPFFFLIIFFRKLGFSHHFSYLLFLSLYYYLGMIGFYLLARRILHDKITAFVAYLLLMFSSLATRPFDSFIIFEFIPMVWFFFFAISFLQTPRRSFLIGMTFSMMIIFTTYLPFYFITIVILSTLVFIVLYPLRCRDIYLNSIAFIKSNKILICICLIAFCLSLIPGIRLLKASSEAEFVLPSRSRGLHAGNSISIEVGYNTVAGWGITEDLMYSAAFNDLHKFKFAVMYVPVFVYIMLLLGIFLKGNKLLLYLFLFGSLIYLFHCPYAPIYRFLYNHIFFYRYFRNLHFFLWWVLLPVFILFAAENMKLFLNLQPEREKDRYLLLSFIIAIHFILAVLIFKLDHGIFSSYMVIALSMVFFISYTTGLLKKTIPILFYLLILIVLQPIEVYHYLAKNSSDMKIEYLYDKPYQDFFYKRNPRAGSLHYATKWYGKLVASIEPKLLKRFAGHKIYIFNNTSPAQDKDDFKKIEKAIKKNKDIAFIFPPYKKDAIKENAPIASDGPIVIQEEDSWFHIIEYTANTLKIKTDFKIEKFLLYCDNYSRGWKAFINGVPVDIIRTDIAFKGIWLPAGENIIYFKFGSWEEYFLNYFLLCVFFSMFIALIFFGLKDGFYADN